MRKMVRAVVAVGVACGFGLAAGSVAPASATEAGTACQMQVSETQWGAGVLNLKSCDAFARSDWDFDGYYDETFAVRVDRTVWHSWPGSNGWALMPGNKTADDINNYPVNGQSATWWSGSTLSVRNLSVWVTGGTGYWCTSDPGTGWTGHWRDC